MKVMEPCEVKYRRSEHEFNLVYRRAKANEEAFLIVRPKRRFADVYYDTSTSWPRFGRPGGLSPRFRLPETVLEQLKKAYTDYLKESKRQYTWFIHGPEIGKFAVLKEHGFEFAKKVAAILREYDDTPQPKP